MNVTTASKPAAPAAAAPAADDRQQVLRSARVAWTVGLAILVAAPFIGLYPVFMMKALCFAIFACAFNLLLGFTGLLSFGHAAFMGAAAYATGWLVRSAGWSPEFGLLAGVAVGGGIGLLVGLIAIRREGIYFAMITLAMAQMVYFVCLQAPFTGGEDGLQGVPRGRLFGLVPLDDDLSMYFVVLAIFVLVFLAIMRIVHSPYGQVLKAIRENEPRAVSLGYHVNRYKLLAFVLSTAIAGLAGSLKTLVLGFATLSDVHWSLSGEVVLMTLLGGMGTFAGPVIGAFTIIGLQNFLADRVGSWVTVIIGGIFVVCVLAFRRGIVGELLAWRQRRLKGSTTPGGH
ncbi:branched-chain amino acid transport system permease protein LivM [Piscinibacter sakaiensis]|uniref:Branched-chain amino acid transport system permease protein LivM n=2 Tax=Piscinibacter sakaiensis TaxID=1547922 RepID=A0A0K8P099_PISS1|nr:branched-chain amino acid ABC transporter permease [Piscinibacter sakaiensis]GAP36077.1 branched-chain amino acid transport system permease protein LivM [Piscinibacter sakaiensis]